MWHVGDGPFHPLGSAVAHRHGAFFGRPHLRFVPHKDMGGDVGVDGGIFV